MYALCVLISVFFDTEYSNKVLLFEAVYDITLYIESYLCTLTHLSLVQ